jgi:hypothetical protein
MRTAAIDRLIAALASGRRVYEVMREDERRAGRTVIVPGDVEWLPAADWDETVVVSLDGQQVRLIAILAKNPGNGAFRRLIAAICAAELVPIISTPTNEMRETLKRWGWKGKIHGWGEQSEELWKPRTKVCA